MQTRRKDWNIGRYVKNIDMFGYPVHLNFEGKTGGA